MTPHRYTVAKIDAEWFGGPLEPPTYEVRRNRGGTSDDWHQGECMGVFDTQTKADRFAEQLRTLTLPACPRCNRALSCNSLEQYCGYTNCAWNNENVKFEWDARTEERKALDRSIGHLGNALMHLKNASAAAGAANCDGLLLEQFEMVINHIDLLTRNIERI